MAKFPFSLLTDEQVIDTWTLIYTPPGGGKYNGKDEEQGVNRTGAEDELQEF